MNDQIMEQRIVARAAATDAADRHMRGHERKAWSEADYNYAVSEFRCLCPTETEPKK